MTINILSPIPVRGNTALQNKLFLQEAQLRQGRKRGRNNFRWRQSQDNTFLNLGRCTTELLWNPMEKCQMCHFERWKRSYKWRKLQFYHFHENVKATVIEHVFLKFIPKKWTRTINIYTDGLELVRTGSYSFTHL